MWSHALGQPCALRIFQVAFGIFLTELGVSSDEDAMVERTADSLCGALSRPGGSRWCFAALPELDHWKMYRKPSETSTLGGFETLENRRGFSMISIF